MAMGSTPRNVDMQGRSDGVTCSGCTWESPLWHGWSRVCLRNQNCG